jgi:hypothetical protein
MVSMIDEYKNSAPVSVTSKTHEECINYIPNNPLNSIKKICLCYSLLRFSFLVLIIASQ